MPHELAPVLEQMSSNPQRPAALRAQARRFQRDDLLQRELADALTIMLAHQDEWQWTQEGVPVYAGQTPGKWRLFTADDLPTACFLELLGARWYEAFQQFLRAEQEARLKQLRRLAASGEAGKTAPASQVHQAAGLGMLGAPDLWAEAAPGKHSPLEEELSGWVEYNKMDYGSVFKRRAEMRGKLRDVQEVVGYGLRETITGMENALLLLHAEVQLARAAFPGRPFYLLKIDLKDFYPTLPHALLLRILSRFGLTPEQLAFFRTYLRVPMQEGGQVVQAERGAPNLHALSDALGDLVLGLLEWQVQRVARVQMVRMVDDIGILATSAEEAQNAWQAVQAFCADCGLVLNVEKCGAVCVHGERPAGLPAGPFSWLLLNLDEQGDWYVNTGAFESYLAQAREQVRLGVAAGAGGGI
jgi:hypothetical protein